ncbi:DUF4019 domain-containing protein [bacterium]|nr:DUF4019 domain-containing protein [bacterium]
MRRITTILAALVLAGSAALAASEKETAAVAAAEKWLGLVDAGDYTNSWQEAAAYFRNVITQEQWARAVQAARRPLGDLVVRKVKATKYTASLPGAPDGEYVVIQFESSFARKKTAVETVTPLLDKDGQWQVSGYLIH